MIDTSTLLIDMDDRSLVGMIDSTRSTVNQMHYCSLSFSLFFGLK